MHSLVISANMSNARPMFGQVSPHEKKNQTIFCYRVSLLTILDLPVSDVSYVFCQNA